VVGEAGKLGSDTGSHSAALVVGAELAKSRTATDTTLVEAVVGMASLWALGTHRSTAAVMTEVADTTLASAAGSTRVAAAAHMSTAGEGAVADQS